MKPLTAAALISGGWAAVVAALGYRFNRATANATIQATNANALTALDAAHAAQLWEKKAEAYTDAIAAITRRQVQRHHLIRPPSGPVKLCTCSTWRWEDASRFARLAFPALGWTAAARRVKTERPQQSEDERS